MIYILSILTPIAVVMSFDLNAKWKTFVEIIKDEVTRWELIVVVVDVFLLIRTMTYYMV